MKIRERRNKMAEQILKQEVKKDVESKEVVETKGVAENSTDKIEDVKKVEKGPVKEKTEEIKVKKPKKEKKDRVAILNIYTTFNNTIMNLTDMSGNSIAKFSGGQSTNQDRLKANPTVAMFISQKIAEEARDNGITGFYVKIRARTGQANPGPGTHAAIKSLTRAGFRILSIMDTTRMARGGPKKKGGRRGRRV
jgi:small subunit ribosomal protein S11